MKFYELNCGNVLETTEESKASVCKECESSQSDNRLYYLKMHDNQYIDPFSFSYTRYKQDKTKWKPVSAETFDFYMRYLKSGSPMLLKQVERNQ